MFHFVTLYTVRCVNIYGSVNINKYILQLLSVTIFYTCALLKSHMNTYQGGRSQSREE